MSSTVDFTLPDNLTIASVHGLHEKFESLIDTEDCDELVIHAKAVSRADTAGVQLLLALVHESKDRRIAISWDAPSEKLTSAATILGLENALGFH